MFHSPKEIRKFCEESVNYSDDVLLILFAVWNKEITYNTVDVARKSNSKEAIVSCVAGLDLDKFCGPITQEKVEYQKVAQGVCYGYLKLFHKALFE